MADVVFVAVVLAFFALVALYVRACVAIVGATSEPTIAADIAADDTSGGEAVAA